MSNIVLAAGGGEEGYQISRSVRLRSSASAYFNRTPASAGNRKTWTWSGWVKRGTLSGSFGLFSAGQNSTNNIDAIEFNASNQIRVYSYNSAYLFHYETTAVYRDCSAWYHLVVVVDTTHATAASRVKIYVNGTEVTSFATQVTPTQNTDCNYFNTANLHTSGATYSNSRFFDGYLTEVNFIDGQALTPMSFGETDVLTGVWKPKRYAGTYGTNGFYLNFSDNSAATAAAIGKDWSGNGNNWTPNNISVTAGPTYDSMIDTPTPFGQQGNFNVWNPLSKGANVGLTNGNLDALGTVNTNTGNCVFGSIAVTTGKWYAEFKVTNTYSYSYLGVVDPDNPGSYPGANSAGYGMEVGSGLTYNVAAGPTITGASAGETVMVALDMDSGKIWWGKNGVWGGSGNPGAGTGQQFSGLTGQKTFALSAYSSSGTFNANFGQRPFAYTPPTGFKALNTFNLPDSTVKKGNAYFDVKTYAGSASSQTISGFNFQPDLIWFKERTTTGIDNFLVDSARSTYGSRLQSNTTAAEAATGAITSINSTSYTLAGGASNTNDAFGRTYVTWNWKESASAGFDIVTYAGSLTAAGNVAINHNLGVAPKLVISKSLSPAGADSGNWNVQVPAMGADKFLFLNTTAALIDSVANGGGSRPVPTSTQFYTSWNSGSNISGNNYIAYVFAEVAGFSKFGSYTGNGSADGTFVYLGFRPRYLMVKRTDSLGAWTVWDSARDTYNVQALELEANNSNSEANLTGSAYDFDFLSNGVKFRGSGASQNASGGTYIYAAFAENPFKNSLAR